MRVIHKQELEIVGEQTLPMKASDLLLKIAVQNGRLCVWYLTETETNYLPLLPRTFRIVGTGYNLGDISVGDYVDTVLMPNGNVWHIFIPRR